MKSELMLWITLGVISPILIALVIQSWRLGRAHGRIYELEEELRFMEMLEAARVREGVLREGFIVKAIGEDK